MSRRILSILSALPVVLCMALLLLFPARYMASVTEGLKLWAVCVLPASLPFLFLSSLFARGPLFRGVSARISPVMGKLFHVSGAGGCAALLAALSGYPVGARMTLDLAESGRIAREETFRLACLSTTGGPVFLIGTVGAGMLNSPSAGAVLLLCHLLAVWGVSLFLRGKTARGGTAAAIRTGNALYESVSSAVSSVLFVGASIALFSAFGQMLSDLLPFLPEGGRTFLRGLTEMTAGCAALARSPSPISLAGCAFFVTFGGACVLVQEIGFLSRAGVKTLPFLLVKLVQGAAAAALAFAFGLLLYPQS